MKYSNVIQSVIGLTIAGGVATASLFSSSNPTPLTNISDEATPELLAVKETSPVSTDAEQPMTELFVSDGGHTTSTNEIGGNQIEQIPDATETGGAPIVTTKPEPTQTPSVSVPTMPTETVPAPVPEPAAELPIPASTYADGSYTTIAAYRTPGGSEDLTVSLTLEHDLVTAVDISYTTNDHESRRYQEKFAAAYKQHVIGKDISTLKLSRVSGSSLTTKGFNTAIEKIKSKASV